MIEARLICDLDGLEALAGDWDALWRRSPVATPFQAPSWLIPWARTFAPGAVRCAAAFLDGRLAALLPFYLEATARGRLLPLGISLSDYLDVLGGPEALAAAVARLRETALEWRFENLPPDAAAWRLAPPAEWNESEIEQDACPVLTLAGPDLGVSARQRRKLRRAQAAAERRGAVAYEADWPADAFLDLLFALHRARWESRGEGGVLADADVQAFHRAALPRLQAAGLARAFVMTIAGRPVGAYYGFAWGARAYAYLGGFDPDFEESSPGALTIQAALTDAVARGATELHFLRGREAYKYAWGARDRTNRARIWTRADV